MKTLPFKSLISASQLEPSILMDIFRVTDVMGELSTHAGRVDILADKMIALLFYEPSSRTMLSFQTAAQRLKAGVILAQSAQSASFQKGESIEDMIRVASSYADLVVMRHSQSGSAAIAAAASSVPFINAGDGDNEHPTQALIDSYTLFKEVGRLDNLKITFGFDPLQSRSIHSLTELLSNFKGNRFTFVSPDELRPKKEFIAALEAKGVACHLVSRIEDALDADVIYLNRLQEERFSDRSIFEQHRKSYILTRAMVEDKALVILDPLPRIDEIALDVDQLPQAAYFRQAAFGVPLRMALMAMALERG